MRKYVLPGSLVKISIYTGTLTLDSHDKGRLKIFSDGLLNNIQSRKFISCNANRPNQQDIQLDEYKSDRCFK